MKITQCGNHGSPRMRPPLMSSPGEPRYQIFTTLTIILHLPCRTYDGFIKQTKLKGKTTCAILNIYDLLFCSSCNFSFTKFKKEDYNNKLLVYIRIDLIINKEIGIIPTFLNYL